MNITDFISPQHVIVDLRAADKPQLLRELPWGQRALRVYDPDGHFIDIGSPLRSLNL